MFLQHKHGSEEEPWSAASIHLGWRQLRAGVYKINVNGTYDGRKARIGVVVRDHVSIRYYINGNSNAWYG